MTCSVRSPAALEEQASQFALSVYSSHSCNSLSKGFIKKHETRIIQESGGTCPAKSGSPHQLLNNPDLGLVVLNMSLMYV